MKTARISAFERSVTEGDQGLESERPPLPPPIKAKIEVTRRPFPTTTPPRSPPNNIRTLPTRPSSPSNVGTPPLRFPEVQQPQLPPVQRPKLQPGRQPPSPEREVLFSGQAFDINPTRPVVQAVTRPDVFDLTVSVQQNFGGNRQQNKGNY